MALSFLCAFAAPTKWTDLGRVQLEGVFVPVSRPAYEMANWVRNRVVAQPPEDSRSAAALAQENFALRQEISRLQAQVERLSGLEAQRQSLGDLKTLCERFSVGGTDSGNRDGLILGGADFTAVRPRQPVLYSGGLAGRIDRVGPDSAHVRLLTDTGFPIIGRFIRFVRTDAGVQVKPISQLQAIVEGMGDGQMSVTKLAWTDVVNAGLKPDDWVILADNDWPAALQGVRLGRVASIDRWKKHNLFAEIKLEPQASLMRLGDVWVMTRGD